jgi:hypothetical protein
MLEHPYRELMLEAEREQNIAASPEALALQDRVLEAVTSYVGFLERQGLVWGDDTDWPRLKAQSLVVTFDFGDGGSFDIALQHGALDRVYGNGRNPDPFGAGPSDIPRKPQ